MAEHSFKNVTKINHPLIARDLTLLRDKTSSTAKFRKVLQRIATILAYHALKPLPLSEIRIETPVQKTTGYKLDKEVLVVPILRAGLSLVDAILAFIPDARVGHLGMYRDEKTFEPVDYYSNIPKGIKDAMTLVVDPMLATGGSADDAISFLKKKGAQNIQFIGVITAPEGLKKLEDRHPDVSIITADIDSHLNDQAFIVPGLGDAGDRYFGTL